MELIELMTWATLGCLPAFLLLDVVYQARKTRRPRLWRVRAAIVTVFAVGLSIALPTAWYRIVGEWSLFGLSGLGTLLGAATGILVYQFIHYWYHRAIHRSDFLWRWFHQMHHSAESLDAWGAYYLSPLDAAMFISLGTVAFGPILGLSASAAAVANLFITFCAIFQHANLKTPVWLGYLIQRPESHGVHHERGVHRYNYCDLPIMDMAFGTFKNPRVFDRETGFYDGASARIGEMLLGRDVSVPPYAGETVVEPVATRRAA